MKNCNLYWACLKNPGFISIFNSPAPFHGPPYQGGNSINEIMNPDKGGLLENPENTNQTGVKLIISIFLLACPSLLMANEGNRWAVTHNVQRKSVACRQFFSLNWLVRSPGERLDKPVRVSNPQELFQHITEGGIASRGQEMEFMFYLLKAFGERLAGKNLGDVLDIMEQYPGQLNKLAVREQEIRLFLNKAILPTNIESFLKSFRSSANKGRRVFQISANWGLWARILSFETSALGKKERNEQFFESLSPVFDQSVQDFIPAQALFFAVTVPQTVKEFIEDPLNSYRKRTLVLYKLLDEIRTKSIKERREDSKENLSITMVELIHSAGFGNKHWTKMLKDPETVIEGIRSILLERDVLAQELGFKEYQELKQVLLSPFRSSRVQTIRKELAQLELRWVEIIKKLTGPEKALSFDETFSLKLVGLTPSIGTKFVTETFRVRPLTGQESPFRGCLGGDCSTDADFEKAMDPAYLYWTLTDREMVSHGHVTVVLGKARDQEGDFVKTAFVDKIQNIPTYRIVPMLEAIRQSLKEQDYILALPEAVGDHDGLSIDSQISHFVQEKLLPKLKNPLKLFQPEKTKFPFKSIFSRAGLALHLWEFAWPTASKDFKVKPLQFHPPKKMDISFKIQEWLLADRESKSDSKSEKDQFLLISNLPYSVGLDVLEESYAVDYLLSKLKDKALSFELRKKALYALIQIRMGSQQDMEEKEQLLDIKFLLSLFLNFSEKEQKALIGEMSNWKTTTVAYRKDFITILSQALFDFPALSAVFKSPLHVLLDRNATPPFYGGHTALTYAVTRGEGTHILKTLIENGVDPNVFDDMTGWTPLIWAIRKNNKEAIKFLLEMGADPNAKDSDGMAPWLWAAFMENISALKILYKAGADIYAVNAEGATALMLVGSAGHAKNNASLDFVFEKMLNAHTKDKSGVLPLQARDRDGATALHHWAILPEKYAHKLKKLIAKGADLHAEDINNKTALDWAREKRNKTAISILLSEKEGS